MNDRNRNDRNIGAPPDDGSTPEERAEWRDAAITFVPAVLVGFALNYWFEDSLHWTSRRSLFTSIAIGIALALVIQGVLQRVIRKPAP